MTPNEPVIITFKDFYAEVKKDFDELESAMNKLKTQLAAQWIVHGILLASLTVMFGIGISKVTG